MPQGDRSSARGFALLAALAATAVPAASARADGLAVRPVLGAPASNVELIGAAPAAVGGGEIWAQGDVGPAPVVAGGGSASGGDGMGASGGGAGTVANERVLLRAPAGSERWQVVRVADGGGRALGLSWRASAVTSAGGVVLASGGDERQRLVTRDPGGTFAVAPDPATAPAPAAGSGSPPADPAAPAPTAPLDPGEQLWPASGAPLLAPFDADGHTGAYVAPVARDSRQPPASAPGVLRFAGGAWSREPLCDSVERDVCTPPAQMLTTVALAGAGAGSTWLLARDAAGRPQLFQRQQATDDSAGADQARWLQRHPRSFLLGSPARDPISGADATTRADGPQLTATTEGVWVDLRVASAAGSGDASVLVSTAQPDGPPLGSWCEPRALCSGAAGLGAALPETYGSFAWPAHDGDDPGQRLLSGLPNGALLRFDGAGDGVYTIGGGAGGGVTQGPGGVALSELDRPLRAGGAAFLSPLEGWLGNAPAAGAGLLRATPEAGVASTALTPWPVPFRTPLLALTGQPGTAPADPSAQALAVGAGGEVARYLPGHGWSGEYLFDGNGRRLTPTLRGVAWPEPGRAYAVGDNGAMWLWNGDANQWQADPAAPVGFRGNLTAVAFSPSDPTRGYAVGKQGIVLAYGKSWTQEQLPDGLAQAFFTSVAFAGQQAIATYRMLDPADPFHELGGLLVNDGSGWRRDASAQALLDALPKPATVLSKAAGLPDGGAVVAGPGIVLERDSAGGPWRTAVAPLPEARNVAALAAVRDGDRVRALAAADVDRGIDGDPLWQAIDNPQAPALGEYGILLGADPLPQRGFLLRETADGWQDLQHDAFPAAPTGDLPGWPDPVLALLVDTSGGSGWAVGGQTGTDLTLFGNPGAQAAGQTASAARIGSGPPPPQATAAPVALADGEAAFAVGGGSQCAAACADFAGQRLGPDAWLTAALRSAAAIDGLHGFLYTGPGVAPTPLTGAARARELARHAALLQSGALPVWTTATSTELPEAATGTLGGALPAGRVPDGTPAPPAGSAAYALDSPGIGGTVRLIVLDYSGATLGPAGAPPCAADGAPPTDQRQWLCAQLDAAKAAGLPTVVLGNRGLNSGQTGNDAADGATVAALLVRHGASAYLFSAPSSNVELRLTADGASIPAYGTATLGYTARATTTDYLGQSGFLLLTVRTATRDAATNRAAVSAAIVPNTDELGLDATDGTLLRRSQLALFEGLARRPRGGGFQRRNANGDVVDTVPQPYTPIPQTCTGANCAKQVALAYRFSSSNPQVGDFVAVDPTSSDPRAVKLDAARRPLADGRSGLFCAYNPGTTTITLSAGGRTYSQQVTVQEGSVQQPCGTVPAERGTAPGRGAEVAVPPAAPAPPAEIAPTPTRFSPPSPGAAPAPAAPAPPPATPAVVVPPPSPLPAPPPIVPPPGPLPPPATPVPPPLRAITPPPAPSPARPTPPSGSAQVPSQVSQPVGAPEQTREEEAAVEVVHHMAAHRPGQRTLPPWSPFALALLAAIAASGAVLTTRRSRGGTSARTPPPALARVRHERRD